MNQPLTTLCAHNFCKSCLQDTFAGQTFVKERNCEGRRTLRAQKNIMKCPSCATDISEYLQNPQVNRELMSVIESHQRQTKENEENTASEEEPMNAEEDKEVKAEETDANEATAKSSPKAGVKRKADGVTDDFPNKKQHQEADNMTDVVNDPADIINSETAKQGPTESVDSKVVKAGKVGRKTPEKTKDGAGAKSRTKKA